MQKVWDTLSAQTRLSENQSRVLFPLWEAEIWSAWHGWKNFLIINNLESKVIREDTILLLLSLPHVPSIFLLRHFQFRLCFYSSALTATSKCHSPRDVVLSALLDLPSLHPLPPPLLSFIPAFIRPEPISTFASTIPRSPSVDSLHRSSFLCYFNPLRFSSSHHHIHSSIPQLLALRTSAIINLVQPQELGHWGTLEHVTLQWGPNPLPENCLIHACEQNHTLRAPTHTHPSIHTHTFYGCLGFKQCSLSIGLCYCSSGS